MNIFERQLSVMLSLAQNRTHETDDMDEDMMYQEHPATIIFPPTAVDYFTGLLRGHYNTPCKRLYLVELEVYDFNHQNYVTCIKFGQTSRSLATRFKEFGREYNCCWIKPLLAQSMTITGTGCTNQIWSIDATNFRLGKTRQVV